jgi:hypothetical protein
MAKTAKKAKKKKPAKKAAAKKKPVKKQLAKKQPAKKQPAKKQAPRPMAARAMMPRREDIPGIAAALPDFADWKQAARALKVSPFYTGPDAVPFSRLRATQILDPMRGQKSFNDFFLG